MALGLGSILAVAILLFPLDIAVAMGLVGWFAVLALLDVRVTVLALILARSTLDIAAGLSLVPAGPMSDFNLAAVLSSMLIVLGLVHFAVNRVDVSKIPLFWPFSALLTAFAVGILYAPDLGAALQDWLRAFSVFVLYLLVVDMLRDEKQAASVVKAILFSAVVPAVVGLHQIVTGGGDQYTEGFNRIFATFTHPSPYAFYLVTLLPIAGVVFLHTSSRLGRLGLGLLLPAMMVSVLATFTRMAWLGLIITLLIMVVVKSRRALLALLALLLLIWIAVPPVGERIGELNEPNSSLNARVQRWEEAWTIPSHWQWLTGAGLGAVEYHVGEVAHNDYLKVWVETGVLGSVAFLWLYGSLFRTAIAGYRRLSSDYQRSLVLAFIAILAARAVMAFTDNLIVHPVLEWYLWSLAALAVVLSTPRTPTQEKPPRSPTAALLSEGGGR